MINRYVIGLDPGKSGAMAILDIRKSKIKSLKVYAFPKDEKAIPDLINSKLPYESKHDILLEKVHSMPTDGKKAAFSFGQNNGIILGCLETLKLNHSIQYSAESPLVWQPHFGLPYRRECKSYYDKKKWHRIFAQALFPPTKITQDNADAVLIALYLYESKLSIYSNFKETCNEFEPIKLKAKKKKTKRVGKKKASKKKKSIHKRVKKRRRRSFS